MQNDREDEGQSRTPLEDVLLRRQQKQLEVIHLGLGDKVISIIFMMKIFTITMRNV